MKQQIIRFLKRLADGMILGLGITIMISILGLVAVKANIISGWGSTSGDAGIIIDSNPNNLYTTANNQLTSAKWNTLVQRTKREDVSTSDIALFDTDCQRRAVRTDGVIHYPGYISPSQFYSLYQNASYWYILNTNKAAFNTGPSGTLLKMQRMCNK